MVLNFVSKKTIEWYGEMGDDPLAREVVLRQHFIERANKIGAVLEDYQKIKNLETYDLERLIINLLSSPIPVSIADIFSVVVFRSIQKISSAQDDLNRHLGKAQFDDTLSEEQRAYLVIKLNQLSELVSSMRTKIESRAFDLFEIIPHETQFPQFYTFKEYESIPNYFVALLDETALKVATLLVGTVSDAPHAAAFVAALSESGRIEKYSLLERDKKKEFAKGVLEFFSLPVELPAVMKQLLGYCRIPNISRPSTAQKSKDELIQHYREKLKNGF